MPPEPYRITPLFDEHSLPEGLRRDHSTKAGVWGLIRAMEGRLQLEYGDGTDPRIVNPGAPGLILPEQVHRVEPLGPMRMRVEFYHAPPEP